MRFMFASTRSRCCSPVRLAVVMQNTRRRPRLMASSSAGLLRILGVLCKHNPFLAPRPHQPGFVVNALLRVCSVYRDHRVNGVASGAKGVRDEVAAETSIDKE